MSKANELMSHLLWRTGLSELLVRRAARNGRFGLMFHGVSKQRYSHLPFHVQPSMTQQEFDLIMGWLQPRFPFLTLEQFLKGKQPGVLLTFDDGLANNVELALPILEKYKAPAIFYVTVQHVIAPHDWLPASRNWANQGWPAAEFDQIAHDFYDGMTEQQLADCGRHPLITIGGHTWSHPFLTQCTDEALQKELIEAKQYLEDMSHQSITTFAYPTGDYDLRITEAVKQAGYTSAFVEQQQKVGIPSMEIKRVGIYQAEPAYLSTKLSGLYQPVLTESYG